MIHRTTMRPGRTSILISTLALVLCASAAQVQALVATPIPTLSNARVNGENNNGTVETVLRLTSDTAGTVYFNGQSRCARLESAPYQSKGGCGYAVAYQSKSDISPAQQIKNDVQAPDSDSAFRGSQSVGAGQEVVIPIDELFPGENYQLRVTLESTATPGTFSDVSTLNFVSGSGNGASCSTGPRQQCATGRPLNDEDEMAPDQTLIFNSSDGSLGSIFSTKPGELPEGLDEDDVPLGFFNFTVTGVATGGSVTITIVLPAGSPANALVKCDAMGVCGVLSGVTRGTDEGGLPTLSYVITDGDAYDTDPDDGEIGDPVAPVVIGGSSLSDIAGGALGGLLLLPLFGVALWRRRG